MHTHPPPPSPLPKLVKSDLFCFVPGEIIKNQSTPELMFSLEVYESNIPIILRRHQEGTVCSVYNFRIDNQFTVLKIMQAANEIYDRQNRAF